MDHDRRYFWIRRSFPNALRAGNFVLSDLFGVYYEELLHGVCADLPVYADCCVFVLLHRQIYSQELAVQGFQRLVLGSQYDRQNMVIRDLQVLISLNTHVVKSCQILLI